MLPLASKATMGRRELAWDTTDKRGCIHD